MIQTVHNFNIPLKKADRLSNLLGIDLWIKRDDLLPMTGGGNKVRKMARFVRDAEQKGCNAIVTTGGLQSNHARVAALMAAEKGWPCRLILHGNPEERPGGNLLLIRLAGAEVTFVEPMQIRDAMQQAMDELANKGYRPYEVPGGGHSLIGSLAYVDAAEEASLQFHACHCQLDFAVLASGTGTTQAGLIAGFEKADLSTKVIGISVARKKNRGTQVIDESLAEVRSHFGMTHPGPEVDFRDDWVGDGYEKAGHDVLSAIRLAAETNGLILDPTYTGKAFLGLLDLVKRNEIPQGSKVLFWHTGGLLNLMATQYNVIGENAS